MGFAFFISDTCRTNDAAQAFTVWAAARSRAQGTVQIATGFYGSIKRGKRSFIALRGKEEKILAERRIDGFRFSNRHFLS